MTARVLVLGGTAEARSLCRALARRLDLIVTAALAGRTVVPADYGVQIVSGSFGGTEGLAAYLGRHRIDLVIDATHPFAARMHASAVDASAVAGVPLIRLERAPWRPRPTERWRIVADLSEAARRLPSGARVFLATGSGSLPGFVRRHDVSLVLRAIEPPPRPLPSNLRLVTARPPFVLAREIVLLRRLGITHLVARNSGGADGRGKFEAARRLAIPVLLVARPRTPPADVLVQSVPAALAAIDRSLAGGRLARRVPA